jgi:glycosyltransferase involved in cell wall biosynthesis
MTIKQFKNYFYHKYPDFDWKTYINLYDDLAKFIDNEIEAIKHYDSYGFYENRIYRIDNDQTYNPLLLVIIPIYNAEKTVEKSIRSVLDQSYKNIHIIAVNDCSTDNSNFILQKLAKSNPKISILKTPFNAGCYSAINYALFVYKFLEYDLVTIHGADDIMLPEKLKIQIESLKDNSKLFCSTGYERIDSFSGETSHTCNAGHSMVIYKRIVFEELGYFDNTRFGGDSEFYERAIKKYTKNKEINIKQILTKAFYENNNLTKLYPLKSKIRSEYVLSYKNKHEKMNVDNNYYLDSIWTEKKYVNKKIICGVASIPDRIESLKDTIESIIDQVDELIIYQNKYYNDSFLKHPKITVYSSMNTGRDLGDSGKFYKVNDYSDAIYFSIDDDIIYPNNYIETMLTHLRKYSYQCIVTCHGRFLESTAKTYRDCKNFYSFAKELTRDKSVHFGGTGVMAFDTSYVKIQLSHFFSINIADIWMGLYAQKHKIPIIVVSHDTDWLKLNSKVNLQNTLWEKNKNSNILNDIVCNFNKNYQSII